MDVLIDIIKENEVIKALIFGLVIEVFLVVFISPIRDFAKKYKIMSVSIATVLLIVLVFIFSIDDKSNIIIPDVGNMEISTAKVELLKVGLSIGNIDKVESKEVKKDFVIDQSPSASQKVPSGTKINLIISTGNPYIKTPNIINLARDKAENILKSNNLNIGEIKLQSSTSIPEGNVISQIPYANEEIKRGESINITVSVGNKVNVPKVIGKTKDMAISELEKIGLKVGKISYNTETNEERDTVIEQSLSNTLALPGNKIDLTISDKPIVTYIENMTFLSKYREDSEIGAFTSNTNEQYLHGYKMARYVFAKADDTRINDEILLVSEYKRFKAVFTPTIEMTDIGLLKNYARLVIQADGTNVYDKTIDSNSPNIDIDLDISGKTRMKIIILMEHPAFCTPGGTTETSYAGLGNIMFIK